MAERVSEYILKLSGDGTDLSGVFAGIKRQVKSDVAEIKGLTDKIDLFGGLQDSLPQVQRALDSAKQKVSQFTAEVQKIKDAGGKAPKELTDNLAAAEKAAAAATKEFARQQQQLVTLQGQLTRAGVDTGNLAAEQVRLAAATKAAADASATMAAKQALGLVTTKDIAAETTRLNAALATLKAQQAAGAITASEFAIAEGLLNAKLKELEGTVTKAGGGLKAFGTDARSALTSIGGPALAAAGGIAAVTAAVNSSITAAREYRQVLAEASAGTDLTREKTAELSREAQGLAQELGLNVNETLRNLFTLLKSGVPADNAIDVLRISADAAKASLSDVGTGVKIAKLFLNDLKIPANDLGHAFDVLKVTVGGSKEGFESFAASAGPLLAVARASNIGLEDLTATLRAMTKSGLETEDAISALQKIILALGSSEARAALHGIGIDASDLVGIFTQLGAKGARLQDVLDLTGLSKKQAAAVATLINDTDRLGAQLARTAEAGGAVAKVNAKLFDTPKEISERFQATLDVTKIKLGELAGTGGRATASITLLFRELNRLLQGLTEFNALQDQQQIAIDQAALKWLGFGAAEKKAADEAANFAAQQAAAKQATEAHTATIEAQRVKLDTLAAALLKNAQALEAAVSEEVKAIEDRATKEIDAIQRAADARAISLKQASADTLLVQQASYADVLAAVENGEALITEAERNAIKIRRELAEGNALLQQKLPAEILQIETGFAAAKIKLYQGMYDTLSKQIQANRGIANAANAERLAFDESVALKIRELNVAGLSDAEAYQQKIRDAQDFTSKARQAAADGDYKLEKKYTDDAIRTAESIKAVVTDQGQVVISKYEAQQTTIGLVKKAAEQYSQSLKDQGKAATEGADTADEKLKTIAERLLELKEDADKLRTATQEAIVLTIADEIVGIDKARAELAELVKPQTKVITVVTVRPGESAPAPESGGVPLARGGFVQRFADGGSVFRPPPWSKVPGSGNGDTVPALLKEGSFVVRKPASQKYGDSFMSLLARGYAGGGSVIGDTTAALDALRYASYVKPFMRGAFWKLALESFNSQIKFVQGHPGDSNAIAKLLKSAQEVAADLPFGDAYGRTATGAGGVSVVKPLLDYEQWLARNGPTRRFAAGGSVGSDTVPAMLTPGEWVVPPGVVKMLGGGFLSALNRGEIPAPRMPRHFATGGPVPGAAIPARGTASVGGLHIDNLTINAAGGDLSDRRVVRKVIDGIHEEFRRAGKVFG